MRNRIVIFCGAFAALIAAVVSCAEKHRERKKVRERLDKL